MNPSVNAAMMRGVVGALSASSFEMTLDGCPARLVAAMRLPTMGRAVRVMFKRRMRPVGFVRHRRSAHGRGGMSCGRRLLCTSRSCSRGCPGIDGIVRSSATMARSWRGGSRCSRSASSSASASGAGGASGAGAGGSTGAGAGTSAGGGGGGEPSGRSGRVRRGIFKDVILRSVSESELHVVARAPRLTIGLVLAVVHFDVVTLQLIHCPGKRFSKKIRIPPIFQLGK